MIKKIISYITAITLVTLLTTSGADSVYAKVVAQPYFDQSAVNIPVGTDTSSNWSGYASTGGTYTSVSGSWIVPTIASSTDLQANAEWVGIGGINSSDLIQAGTQAILNNFGVPVTYKAWIETLPGPSKDVSVSIHPGDSVSVSITEQSSNQWFIYISNNTTHETYSTTVTYNSSRSSAEWIEEMATDGSNGHFIPLDNFGTTYFTQATAIKNNANVTLSGSNAAPITMIANSRTALAVPSQIGNDGQSFNVTRTNALITSSTAISNSSGSSTRNNNYSRRRWQRSTDGAQEFVVPITTSSSSNSNSQQIIIRISNSAPRRLIQQIEKDMRNMTQPGQFVQELFILN